MSRISQSDFVRHFRVIHWEKQEVERVVAREGRPELQEKVQQNWMGANHVGIRFVIENGNI